MLYMTVEHKHCKTTKNIEGESIADAFKKNNLDYRFWIITNMERR